MKDFIKSEKFKAGAYMALGVILYKIITGIISK